MIFSGVDFCATNNGGCSQECVTIVESFFCDCNTGYSLAGDNLTCAGESKQFSLVIYKKPLRKFFIKCCFNKMEQ